MVVPVDGKVKRELDVIFARVHSFFKGKKIKVLECS